MKRIILLLLVLVLSLSLFAACKTDAADDGATDAVEATGEETTTEVTTKDEATEEPAAEISNEHVEWSLMIRDFELAPPNADQVFWKKIEEIHNVKLNLQVVPVTDFNTKVNLTLASGDIPNLMYGANLQDYYSTGIVWELSPYLEKYAPDAYEMMQDPSIWKNVNTDDGEIYYLPSLYGDTYGATYLYFSNPLLDEVGLDTPTTTDEYYNAVKAIQEIHPDKFITAAAYQVGYTNANKPFFYAFGTWPDWVHFEVGEYVYGPYERKDEMKACVTWLNKLYSEGLFDPEYMTIDNPTGMAKVENGQAIATFGWGGKQIFETDENGVYLRGEAYDARVAADEQKFNAIPALKGPEGHQYCQFVGGINGGLNIMTSLEDIERACSVLNWWYTDEGIEMCNWGVEDLTYTKDADGNNVFDESVVKNINEGLRTNGFFQASMLLVVDSAAKNWFASPAYYDTVVAAAPYNLVQNPVLSMTEEELEVFTQKGTDLKVYVDEYIPKFITGELSIEDNYDDYIATLEDIGVQEYMDVVHAAYNRWMER